MRKKPRYVDVERCTGCGECVEKCPRRVPDEFNVGLSRRRAIYLPFPQAVPRKMTIDANHCLYLANREKGRCRLCEEVCQAGAIDWEQQEEIVELDVGAIVVATGFDPYDVSALKEYGSFCRNCGAYLWPRHTVEYLKRTLGEAAEELLALCPRCRQYDFGEKVKALAPGGRKVYSSQ